MPIDAKTHYDRVTDAWKEFMGDNFHFGYFETEDVELSQAAEAMIEKMLEFCDISEDTRILDVGCGIGAPAFYIHEKYHCAVDGISTSDRGIRLANDTSRTKGCHKVRFKVADGLDNEFPDHTFDLVWIMEAAHLMLDKKKLFQECHRVLKDNGTLVLCDLVQYVLLPIHRGLFHFLAHLREYYRLLKAWGPAQLPTLGNYADRLIEAGFRRITIVDITEKAIPTLGWWRKNALRLRDEGANPFPRKDVDNFIAGCEILESFFRKGLFGYGIIKAEK